jgi:hypothetical protein
MRAGQGYVRGVDESRAILERLERIEALDRRRAPPAVILAELRALLGEAEAWSRVEGGEDARRAVDGLRSAFARDMIER